MDKYKLNIMGKRDGEREEKEEEKNSRMEREDVGGDIQGGGGKESHKIRLEEFNFSPLQPRRGTLIRERDSRISGLGNGKENGNKKEMGTAISERDKILQYLITGNKINMEEQANKSPFQPSKTLNRSPQKRTQSASRAEKETVVRTPESNRLLARRNSTPEEVKMPHVNTEERITKRKRSQESEDENGNIKTLYNKVTNLTSKVQEMFNRIS